ncbi:MAG: copper resistance CopC family protein [Pseudomonadota bacterium]
MKRNQTIRALVGASVFSLSVAAHAHSPLQSTVPPEGATLDTAPKVITLSFTRDFRVTRVTATRVSEQPVVLNTGHITAFTRSVDVPLESTGVGDYRIEWRGLSGDGHVQTGAFTFTVR